MIRGIAFLAVAALVAGCVSKRGAPLPPGVECDANRVLYLKGKPHSADIEAEAMQHSGAKRVRWIEPGSAVTRDFRPDRLNLHVDAQGKIIDARCG